MKAIYQNNFKKIKTLIEKKDAFIGSVDLTVYPFHDRVYPHDHTTYSLGPWNNQYSSALCHVNLYQVIDPKQMNLMKFSLVRDGLFTLLDFFHRFPTPKEFKNIFLVHESFKGYIPEKWASSVLFYGVEVFESFYKGKTFNDQLLVKGSLMNGTYDYDQIFQNIDEVRKNKTVKKVIFCTPPRQNNFLDAEWTGDIDFGKINNSFIKRIYLDLAKKVEVDFISWKDFFSMSDTHKFEFLDINSKNNIFIDDYSDFYLFKKGAKPAIIKTRTNKGANDLVIPLTHAHGIRIFENPQMPKNNHHKQLDEIFTQLELKKKEKLNVSAFQAINEIFRRNSENKETKYLI